MGQEIAAIQFQHHDFQRFKNLASRELSLLADWFRNRQNLNARSIDGLESETWMVAEDGHTLSLAGLKWWSAKLGLISRPPK